MPWAVPIVSLGAFFAIFDTIIVVSSSSWGLSLAPHPLKATTGGDGQLVLVTVLTAQYP
jgi:hypothetical protein